MRSSEPYGELWGRARSSAARILGRAGSSAARILGRARRDELAFQALVWACTCWEFRVQRWCPPQCPAPVPWPRKPQCRGAAWLVQAPVCRDCCTMCMANANHGALVSKVVCYKSVDKQCEVQICICCLEQQVLVVFNRTTAVRCATCLRYSTWWPCNSLVQELLSGSTCGARAVGAC